MITFEDSVVEGICLANFDYNGNGYVSKAEAASATNLGQIFMGNTEITRFDELEYFTKLTSIYGTNLVNGGAFYNCTSLVSVKIPSSVTSIGNGAFNGCASLSSIGSSCDSITKIGNQSFYGCSSLSIDVVLPNLQSIGTNAFQNSGIRRILDLGVITNISAASLFNQGVFYGCPNLEVVILPSTITTIGKSSFGGNANLTIFICKATNPPTLTDQILNSSPNATIYVPDSSVDSYVASWTTYSSRIKGISELQTDNAELYAEIESYL